MSNELGNALALGLQYAAGIVPADEIRARAIRDMAREEYHRDGEVEIDDTAPLSEGDDNGTYVQAWVWVSFAGTPYDKDAVGICDGCGAIDDTVVAVADNGLDGAGWLCRNCRIDAVRGEGR